jgi:hypothetical protein
MVVLNRLEKPTLRDKELNIMFGSSAQPFEPTTFFNYSRQAFFCHLHIILATDEQG